MKRFVSLCLGVILSVALISGAAEPASARLHKPDLRGFADIVADPTTGRVFVSEGPANAVLVADTDGEQVAILHGLAGASGMVLDSGNPTLYVALEDAHAIAVVNTTTLAVTTLALGSDVCPSTLALGAGLLWFGYTCRSSWGELGAVDPTTGAVSLNLGESFSDEAPVLASSPDLMPNVLFAGAQGVTPGQVTRVDVTGGVDPTATITARRKVPDSLRDMAISADGADLIVAGVSQDYERAFSTDHLSPQRRYDSTFYPVAVAVRASDGLVAAGSDTSALEPDVYLYRPEVHRLYGHVYFGDDGFKTSRELLPGGLAFGAQNLYAVTADSRFGRVLRLRVITPLPQPRLSVTTDRSEYRYQATAIVTAHLGQSGENRTVTIFARGADEDQRQVAKGEVDSAGDLEVSVPVTRHTFFTARFAGDDTWSDTVASAEVDVHAKVTDRLTRYVAEDGTFKVYPTGTNPRAFAHVEPHLSGTCVYWHTQVQTDGQWSDESLSGCAVIDFRGIETQRIQGDFAVGERIRVRAEWRDDSYNLDAHGAWQYATFADQ